MNETHIWVMVIYRVCENQGQTGHCGNAAIAVKLFFIENARLFFKNTWHFKNIFEDIFRIIEALLNKCESFSKIARFFKYIFSGIKAFQKIRGFFKTFKEKWRLFQ
jgi:hypothetical protein